MPKRSYRQRCALARALDVIGERWTLLLIRELLTGPRRYSELLAGVPGMGTNLLAARLRDLVEAGLVEHDGTRYSLSEHGRELEPAVLALARFGASLPAAHAQGDPAEHWMAHWNVVALKYAFQSDRARKLRAVVEYRIDDSRVQARFHDGTIDTTAEGLWQPDVILTADGETFLALASGELDVEQAERTGALVVEGSRKLHAACWDAFSPTSAPNP